MPFIKKEKRPLVSFNYEHADEPGDLCYLVYKYLLDVYRADPRWKTVHKLYKDVMLRPDENVVIMKMLREVKKYSKTDIVAARDLAWGVFLLREVGPLEDSKAKEHGEIE